MSDTYNMEELAEPFAFEPHAVKNRKDGMKEIGATSDDLWKIPVSKIRRIPGFNVRIKNAEYFARRREYADSMKTEGYLPHKPMAGYVGVDPDSGEKVFFITAGYTRTDAIEVANSELTEEKQIRFVTAVAQAVKDPNDPKSKGLSQDDLNALLIRENKGAALNAYEASIVCKRMADNNNSIDVIAAKTGFSAEWVGSLLDLAAAPVGLQIMVADDVIKPTFAIEVLKEHGDKALAVLQAALARKIGADKPAMEASGQAEEDVSSNTGMADKPDVPNTAHVGADAGDGASTDGGAAAGDEAVPAPQKVRLTAKDLVPPEVRKFNNKVQKEAVALYKAASTVKNDAGFEGLTQESREALLLVLAKLEKYEVNDEPAVDPRQNALFGADASPADAPDANSTNVQPV